MGQQCYFTEKRATKIRQQVRHVFPNDNFIIHYVLKKVILGS